MNGFTLQSRARVSGYYCIKTKAYSIKTVTLFPLERSFWRSDPQRHGANEANQHQTRQVPPCLLEYRVPDASALLKKHTLVKFNK